MSFPVFRTLAGGLAGASVLVACSSGSGAGGSNPPGSIVYTAADGASSVLESPGTCGHSGGPVAGPTDDHCVGPDGGTLAQVTSPQGCYADAAAAPPGGDDGGGIAADAGDIGNCGDPAYGPTMFGNWGSDDDCKYDVTWTSTPICAGQATYFTVIVTKRADGMPLTGADPTPDVVLDCGKAVIDQSRVRMPSPEVAPGTYVIGPVVFPKSGRWVVRFHFNETCLDVADDSPHGHAAFWVEVP